MNENKNKRIEVTKTWLPDRQKFNKYVDQIYENCWLTNNGPFVQKLTTELEKYLGVENLLLVSNGTMALQIAYKVLGISKDVITTPFSFVATTSSIVWEGLNPVFADIDSETLCLDPTKINDVLTERTSAIVPVHVFGNACDIENIDIIAKKHNLKVIYDAAHAFGIEFKDRSILSYGNASTISFHATKIFHTIEGGAIIFKKREDLEKAQLLINFGIAGPVAIKEIGINAKMNEFQAAMGLCVLDEVNEIINIRKLLWENYHSRLPHKVKIQSWRSSNNNYAYFPIILESEEQLLKLKTKLNTLNIFPRRYFNPSLNTVDILNTNKQNTIISENIASRILCLPLHHDIDNESQGLIINVVSQFV